MRWLTRLTTLPLTPTRHRINVFGHLSDDATFEGLSTMSSRKT